MRATALFALLLVLATLTWCKFIRVDPQTQHFIDEHGRTRIFHGVNAVYKVFPYYPPILDHFHPNDSLSDIDFMNLRRFGMNTIRLFTSWQGGEPVKGQYNQTYFKVLQNIVRRANDYGIYVLLDAHQDVGHQKFCGEGLPDWVAESGQSMAKFPFPLLINLKRDNVTGYPLVSDCLKHPFFEYYLTKEVGAVFQNLYSNVNGARDALALFWAAVARVLKDEPNLLGYEVINEPWAGDIFGNPLWILERGKSDRENLMPLYKKVHEELRQVDDQHMLFYEPMVSDLNVIGFESGPGGREYDDRQVLSFHVYCAYNDPRGDPKSRAVCRWMDDEFFKWRDSNVKKIGGGRMLTEFGAVSDAPIAIQELNWVLDQSDKRSLSWMYWQFKYYSDITTASRPGTQESFYDNNGNLQKEKVKALSRTYPQAICGVPTLQYFNTTNSAFKLVYQASDCNNMPTEIYASKDFHYENGFTVNISPANAATYKVVDEVFIYVQHSASVKPGDVITVDVARVI
jgi:endoglycosylceramidase